jgi:Flp pilus assembly protein TadD
VHTNVSGSAEIRRLAEEAERERDWEKASRLRDRVALEFADAGLRDRFLAARAVIYAGRIGGAINVLRLFGFVPNKHPTWTMKRAEVEERRGRDAQAVKWWRKAANLKSDPYWALFGLARSLHRLGHAGEARETMARALALPSAEPHGVKFAAVLDVQTGNFEQAEAKLSSLNLGGEERDWTILAGLPGMTSQAERLALSRAARRAHGIGHAVDLGCWLGSLSISMALGFRGNPQAQEAGVMIHAYDAFTWLAPYMNDNWVTSLPMERPADGASFLPVFQRLVRPWHDLIEVHSGDLMETRWISAPIELLSVDAMKSPEVAQKIILEFYPWLVTNQSLLFHQDFCHGYTWWIHVHHYLLRGHFELIDDLEGSAGVLFRLVRPFEEGELTSVASADLKDEKLTSEAFAYSMELVSPRDRSTIIAAHIRCELANQRLGRAHQLMKQHKDDPVVDRELAGVSQWAEMRSNVTKRRR